MTTAALPTGTPRLCAFDALRAVALLLGIVLHATESFVPGNDVWVITDCSTGLVPLVAVFAIHVFRLATFFLMAGFFARLVCEKKGLREFVRDRARRILLPLVGAWLVLFPLVVCAWIWGMQVSRRVELPQVAPWLLTALAILGGQAFGDAGLMHLWFLYYLLLLYAVAVVLVAVARIPAAADRLFSRLATSAWGVVALAVPAIVALAFTPERFGVPTPDRSLVPDWRTLTAYGSFTLAGWLLHRQPALLAVLQARRRRNLGAAAGVTTLVTLAFLVMAERGVPTSPAGVAQWAYAAGYGVAMWLWVFGLAGLFLRFFSSPSPVWRYLSDSSYFLYLAHLPLVAFLQVAVSGLPWHWTAKLPLILGLTVPSLLLTYGWFVRPTWIGRLLNGRRLPRGFKA